MTVAVAPDQWPAFVKDFTKRNEGRPARLEILDGETSNPIVQGLPLLGLDLDHHGDGIQVEIMLGKEGVGDASRYLTHTILHVRAINLHQDREDEDQVLEIEDQDGVKTLLYLEKLPELH